MDEYTRGGHTKYSLMVHLIFVTKYRKELFFKDLEEDVKQFLFDACNLYGYSIIQMETDKDHVHILLRYGTSDSIANIAKRLKQYSTNKMWEYHNDVLEKLYWKRRSIWSDGYFACSIGQVSQATIEKYIQNQG